MAENDDRLRESDAPRPHGDPLDPEAVEPNRAQRQTDAVSDVVGSDVVEDRIETGSTVNGVAADDPTDGERRKKLYENGATLVSRID